MTRKDYVLIAQILNSANNEYNYNGELNSLIKWFAEDLKATNPNFDSERFLKACGI